MHMNARTQPAQPNRRGHGVFAQVAALIAAVASIALDDQREQVRKLFASAGSACIAAIAPALVTAFVTAFVAAASVSAGFGLLLAAFFTAAREHASPAIALLVTSFVAFCIASIAAWTSRSLLRGRQ